MSSRDVEDLIVRAQPAGINETVSGLEKVEESTEDVADSMGSLSGLMRSIRNSITGVMGAVVAGLAVATGFILSRVPVLGELLDGLSAVVSALGFQLDKQLRPALRPVIDGLFELSNAIFEGDWQAVGQIITNFAQAIAEIDWGGIFAAGIDAISGFIQSARQFIADQDLGPVIEEILSGFGEFIGFAAQRFADFIVEVIKKLPGGETAVALGDLFVSGLSALVNFASEASTEVRNFLDNLNWSTIVGGIVNGFDTVTDFASDVSETFGEFFRNLSWDNIVQNIADGIVAVSDIVTGGIVDLVEEVNWARVTGALASNWAQSMVKAVTSNPGAATPGARVEASGFNRRDPVLPSLSDIGSALSGFGAQRNTNRTLLMDGRRVDQQTGRYGKDRTVRRGGG